MTKLVRLVNPNNIASFSSSLSPGNSNFCSNPRNCCWNMSRKCGFSPNWANLAWVRPRRNDSMATLVSERLCSKIRRSKKVNWAWLKEKIKP